MQRSSATHSVETNPANNMYMNRIAVNPGSSFVSVSHVQGHTTLWNGHSESSMAGGRVDEPMDTLPASISDPMVSENRALLKTLVETQAKMIKMQEEKFQMETEMRQVRIEMQEAKQMLSQVNETVKRLGGTQPLTAERGSSMTGMTSVNFAQPASSSSAADLVGSNNDQSTRMSAVPWTPGVATVKETNNEHEADSLGEQTVEVVRRAFARQPTVQTTTDADMPTNASCRPVVANPPFPRIRSSVEQSASTVGVPINLRLDPTQTTSESEFRQLRADFYETSLAHVLKNPKCKKSGRPVQIINTANQVFVLRVSQDKLPVTGTMNLALVCDSDHGLHRGLFVLCDKKGKRYGPVLSRSFASNGVNLQEISVGQLWMHRVRASELYAKKVPKKDNRVTYTLRKFPTGAPDRVTDKTNKKINKRFNLEKPKLFVWFTPDSDPSQSSTRITNVPSTVYESSSAVEATSTISTQGPANVQEQEEAVEPETDDLDSSNRPTMNTYPRQSSEQERFRDPSELSDDERELYLYLEQEFELMPQVLDADQQFIEEALQLSEADQ